MHEMKAKRCRVSRSPTTVSKPRVGTVLLTVAHIPLGKNRGRAFGEVPRVDG